MTATTTESSDEIAIAEPRLGDVAMVSGPAVPSAPASAGASGGFPPSEEMAGRALAGEPTRIASYGARHSSAPAAKINQEYYENLKSLGYIK